MKKLIIAAGVGVLVCAAAFAGCANRKPHTEHDYNYEYIDASGHKVTCNGCDLDETKPHNYTYEYVDGDTHKRTCVDCNFSDTVAHGYVYEYLDGNSHKVTCSSCNLDETAVHHFSYEYIDEDVHKKTCTICNKTETVAHDYEYEYVDNKTHKRSCGICNVIETVSHDNEYEKIDESNHKTTCSHCVELDETVEHEYSNETDLVCDPCEYKRDWYKLMTADAKESISADGYVNNNIGEFSQYVGTSAYRTVTTADEFVQAIMDARWKYTSAWNADTLSVDQTLTAEGSVHVIEIANDLDLGFNHISENYRAKTIKDSHSYVESYCRGKQSNIDKFSMSDMYTEHGISKIKIENTNNLLVYSKNGARLTHAGFSILSCDNVVFRNLEMDEMWQWEDAASSTTGNVGDYDAFGWAYFKVAHSGYVWIDHCTFGKSYDGQIDYSNPVYNTAGTAFRAPYGVTGENGLHISWCKFNAGSDDPDGYLYKMMAKIEEEYQAGKQNYLYYNALRKGGISFEDILYGLAIPQKKGFLCGDSGNGKEDYDYNLSLQISFANCVFKNIEDRLPKLRGGNAYMYNCVVDSTEYMTYRTKLRAAGAASMVTSVNGGWKCALVSQGIVCGNGGSFKAENCIFKGIETLLKNNDGGGTTEGDKVRPVDAGYQLVNCSYQKTAESTPTTTAFTNSNSGTLKTENFKWNTLTGEAPFEVAEIELSKLESMLTHPWYGAGVNDIMQEKLLNSDYCE
ncbi:MAG: hypothetical protein K2N17_04840 [Clostridia bacterium]|nr:hypothetical protein [Clostridia bacterium]